jgi:UDP-N-acetylglucosamine/UDP-N-acetylgalactosamine diphosphorylase
MIHKENKYFNLSQDNLIFFPQDTIPAIDMNGKIINKEVDEIFLAPNGNGGCFIALKNHKVINKLLEKGIEFINVISIDNPLSKTLDPLFIGLTYREGNQIAAKTVSKRDPTEPVGVFANVNGKPFMIDYADMPKELTELRNEYGDLVYRGGNILNYLINTKLLNEILLDKEKYQELINEFHIGKKKIPSVIIRDKKVERTTTPGVKFELFFNSIFQFCDEKGMLLMEVDRNKEFAPVKNGENSTNDNPRTARNLMTELFKEWYKKSGGLMNYLDERPDGLVEISFLLSYNGEGLVPGANVPIWINYFIRIIITLNNNII